MRTVPSVEPHHDIVIGSVITAQGHRRRTDVSDLVDIAQGSEDLMAVASKDRRPIIKMRSTAGTGFTYVTKKNKINTRDRITLMKYDPVVRRHVEFKEER